MATWANIDQINSISNFLPTAPQRMSTSDNQLDPEHPIDPAIRQEILATLTRVEQGHGVKILFACESGSRGWGFASPDSDYDVRFLYVHPLDWYLTVFPERDVIELPVNEIYDVGGWDLRKALGLLRNGNATLVEWLSSPVVYRADALFRQQIVEAAQAVSRPERAFHHYQHMAQKNYREHLQGETIRLKKYLYVLRPVFACLWIEQGRGPVPMRFQGMVDTLANDDLKIAIAELLAVKRRAAEGELGKPIPAIHAFIEQHLNRLTHNSAPEEERQDFSVLDHLLRDTILRCNG